MKGFSSLMTSLQVPKGCVLCSKRKGHFFFFQILRGIFVCSWSLRWCGHIKSPHLCHCYTSCCNRCLSLFSRHCHYNSYTVLLQQVRMSLKQPLPMDTSWPTLASATSEEVRVIIPIPLGDSLTQVPLPVMSASPFTVKVVALKLLVGSEKDIFSMLLS